MTIGQFMSWVKDNGITEDSDMTTWYDVDGSMVIASLCDPELVNGSIEFKTT